LHLGERQRRTYFGDGKDVPQKKIFYALRPAAALRWLRLHPEAAVAPMHFPTLLEECEPPQDVAEIVQELIAQKMVTRELGSAPLPSVIGAFIDSEFERARALFERPAVTPSTSAREQADAFFRSSVRRLAPGT
jgi:predicted nucleotidyltransferase